MKNDLEFECYTKQIQLQILNEPIKKIISVQHFISNLILDLFQYASKFFNKRYIQYKS